jgi:macrodomain Ter protein organizer (MatP/YcbG family)
MSSLKGSLKGTIHKPTKVIIDAVKEILAPMIESGEKTTIRFILYKLISKGGTKITSTKQYDKLARDINNARIRGEADPYGLPDEPFVDNKRVIRGSPGDPDVNAFVAKVRNWYDRDIWQDQDVRLFVCVEKATVGDVVESITRRYQVPLAVSSGYFGRTFMVSIAEKLDEAVESGKQVYVAYIGDHDPSGMDIEQSLKEGNGKEGSDEAQGMQQLMKQDYNEYVVWERLAITTEEFKTELPNAVKVDIKELEKGTDGKKKTKGDTRSPAYKAKHGAKGAEVEAVDSEELRDRLEKWIRDHLNVDNLEMSRAKETMERETLAGLKL